MGKKACQKREALRQRVKTALAGYHPGCRVLLFNLWQLATVGETEQQRHRRQGSGFVLLVQRPDGSEDEFDVRCDPKRHDAVPSATVRAEGGTPDLTAQTANTVTAVAA